MIEPYEIDLGNKLDNVFGCPRLEAAVTAIVEYLAHQNRVPEIPDYVCESGNNWNKKMCIDTIPEIDHVTFAKLCAIGFLSCAPFPDYAFVVSSSLIKKLQLRHIEQLEKQRNGKSSNTKGRKR